VEVTPHISNSQEEVTAIDHKAITLTMLQIIPHSKMTYNYRYSNEGTIPATPLDALQRNVTKSLWL
jgi:hypothetical protein